MLLDVLRVLMGAGAGEASVSVSEPEDSRSQLSATGLDLGLCRGFCGTVVESLRWERVVAISGKVLVGERWIRSG